MDFVQACVAKISDPLHYKVVDFLPATCSFKEEITPLAKQFKHVLIMEYIGTVQGRATAKGKPVTETFVLTQNTSLLPLLIPQIFEKLNELSIFHRNYTLVSPTSTIFLIDWNDKRKAAFAAEKKQTGR